jgi:hypothetical protein
LDLIVFLCTSFVVVGSLTHVFTFSARYIKLDKVATAKAYLNQGILRAQ